MCELLGLSSRRETTINLSLTVLAERGETPNLHGDGWGIAFHEGNDVRLIKDAGPAKDSEWVEFIKKREIHAHDIIAHIRKSTVGRVNYSNTHPFTRELMGRIHSFAHNGTLKDLTKGEILLPYHYHPVGDTDSEYAFCLLMDQMKELWEQSDGEPSIEQRLHVIKDLSQKLRQLGPLNFLYSDGDTFFAHGDVRHDPLTQKLIWPGLYYLRLDCREVSDGGLSIQGEDDSVILFASVPLNEMDWKGFERGEILAVTKGEIVAHVL